MKKMNKSEKKRFIEDLELIIVMIGIFIIVAGTFGLFKIEMNDLVITWMVIGVLTVIYRFILGRKLK